MGQKVNPIIFRIGETRTWTSKWFSKNDYASLLKEDIIVKRFLKKKLKEGGVSNIEIERSGNNMVAVIHTAKPGLIIGRGGEGVEILKKQIQDAYLTKKTNLTINIIEVKSPNTSAELVLQAVIADLEKRIPFRRAMKQAIARVQKAGAKGVKIICSGRLNGAEIARREMLTWGSLPLHTIRADIDYSRGAAMTTYGKIGVKVWIYKGEKFNK